MCDKNNAEEIVSEMLTYLETADYSIKEEMVIICADFIIHVNCLDTVDLSRQAAMATWWNGGKKDLRGGG